MKLFWLKLKYRWQRLWMCKHERAFLDALIFGKGAYYQPSGFYGPGLAELILTDIQNKIVNRKEE
jgi:hypothetical protein